MTGQTPITQTYLPMDRRHALLRQAPLPDRLSGSVLFADISGFTPLTEALAGELGPQRGAEELTRILNEVYTALITEVHRYRGSVISFSGDAITCWFSADDGRQAITCALNIQQVMQQFTQIQTPGGTAVSLGIKTAVVTGQARRFVVGDPAIQRIDTLAGRILDEMASAEHQAERGDVVVSEAIADRFAGQLTIEAWREEAETGARFAVITGLATAVPENPWTAVETLAEAEARRWLWPSIYERLQGVRGEFLAELRLATALFLQFTGIDYDHDDEAGARLDAYIRWVQQIIARYDGTLLQLTIGDKGSYLYAAFGAPVAHDDDPSRAVAAALALQQMPPALDFIQDVRVGLSQGQMRAGAYGSPARRTYGVLGDKVNLSARLMGLAPVGEVRTDFQVFRRAQSQWEFEVLTPVRVKGKVGLIRVYRPTGQVAAPSQTVPERDLFVGRKRELGQLTGWLDEVGDGRSRLVFVEGEAGIGKSRLVLELVASMRRRGLTGLMGTAQSIEQHTPYRAWRDIFSSYLELDHIGDAAERRAQAERIVQEVAPEQMHRLPLLKEVLNLELPETELTAALSPELRQEGLVVLLVALLRAWARERPLILILEDAQWLDSLSWELAIQVARAFQASADALMFVLVTRPLEANTSAGQHAAALANLPGAQTISLENMDPEETVTLVTHRLELPEGALPPEVADLVRSRADGNPFFAEEVVYTLRDQGVLQVTPGTDGENQCLIVGDLARATQAMPDTIHGLILARIDQLEPDRQLMLKVAAVIGRTFAYAPLRHLMAQVVTLVEQALLEQLEELIARDLTLVDIPGPPDFVYIFKHIITQEVAYQTLLFAQRQQLHLAVAAWYENTYHLPDVSEGSEPELASIPDGVGFVLPLLAYHYQQAEDRVRERYYSTLAGEQAARQYANEEAARYLGRALDLLPDEELHGRTRLLLLREAVYDLQGKRDDQGDDLTVLHILASLIGEAEVKARVALRQANYARVVGDQAGVATAVKNGVFFANQVGNLGLEAEGYYIWGQSLRQQGKYEEAQQRLDQAVALARQVPDQKIEADSLLQAGVLNFYQGSLEAARDYYQLARQLYHDLDDLKGESGCMMMLGAIHSRTGQYQTSQSHYQQALQMSRMVGYRVGETIILGNMGVNYADLGAYEAARDCQQQSLTICREIGDREGESFGLSNLALLHYYLGEYETSRQLCEQALAVQRHIEDRRSEAFTLTYLGHTLLALAEHETAATTFAAALALRKEIGDEAGEIDTRAGMARLALATGDEAEALAHTAVILNWIETNGVDGLEHPLQVYLTCYQVLRQTDPDDAARLAQARDILQTAYALMQTQAAAIQDEDGRQQFLQNVPVNRDIAAAWQRENDDV